MSLPAVKIDNLFTYANYCTWPADERWELIYGQAWNMAAPSRLHQNVVLELGTPHSASAVMFCASAYLG